MSKEVTRHALLLCINSIREQLWLVACFFPILLFPILSIHHSPNNHINFTESEIDKNDKRISVVLSMWRTKIGVEIYQHKEHRTRRRNIKFAVAFILVHNIHSRTNQNSSKWDCCRHSWRRNNSEKFHHKIISNDSF